MAAKKAVAGQATPASLPTPEELKTLAQAELLQFLNWASSIESYDYYEALTKPQKIAFDELMRRAFRLERALRDQKLDEFIIRARADIPKLNRAVAAVREEIDKARRTANLLRDVSTLLNILAPIVGL